ncbi:MAG: ketoacyl-ACP synthase III [Candidatus Hydrogenedentes bacterium]|nr:ketoacyl-ACP synthase III [Candidatus Hydrogenedentota bacterium]
MLHTRFIGTGHYLPKTVLTNFDLEKIMDTSDEWIRQRTGIHQRHVAAEDEATSDLGLEAARNAISDAGIAPEEIEYVMCATLTPDYFMPATACMIQQKLGAKRAAALDINAACSGFLYGVQLADALIRSGAYKTILLVAAEKLTVRLDWRKRDTAVLFGDGAGAVVLRGEEGEHGVLSTFASADGSAYQMLHIPSGGSREAITPDNINDVERGIMMDGQALYKRAVKAFGEATERALQQTQLTSENIKLFVPHQANKRIIDSATSRLGIPDEKIYLNLDRVANTSAASIPIALDQARKEGRIVDNDIVLMAAFGAGLTWASAMVRW